MERRAVLLRHSDIAAVEPGDGVPGLPVFMRTTRVHLWADFRRLWIRRFDRAGAALARLHEEGLE